MKTFDEIPGNDLIKDQLRAAIRTGELRHAYMLTGEKGMGKKTMAGAFLLELFCREKDADGRPCRHCPECKKVMSGNHPDIIYITHEKPSTVSVDEIRTQLMDTVSIRPYAGGYKVYVIPDAEMMTVQAQNAVLKTLEEPPAYVIVLLLVSDERSMLDTVRSRVTRESMRPLTDAAVREYLSENLGASGEMADICVAFSKGNLGRAIALWQSGTFSELYQRIMKILRNIKEMSSTDLRVEIGKLQSACPDIRDALDMLELWYRDLTLFMVTRDLNRLVFRGEHKTLMNMASLLSYGSVQEIMDAIDVCRQRLEANVNPELSLELLFLTIRDQ